MDPIKEKQDREIIKPKFLIKLKKLQSVTTPTKYILEVLVNGFTLLAKLKKRSDLFDDILLKWLIVLKNSMGQLDKDLIYSFSNDIIVNFLNILILPKLEVTYIEDLICIWEDIILFFSTDIIKKAVIENITLFQKIVKNMENFGHYFYQLCCFIILSKCVYSCQTEKLKILKILFPEEKYNNCVMIMSDYNYEAIDYNSRKFINTFNENQENITVYSFIPIKIKIDALTLIPPKIENIAIEQWMDFNMGTSSIFFQCDASSFNKIMNNLWIKLEIKPDNLEKIYLDEKDGHLNLELATIGCFCLDEDYNKFLADSKSVQFLFSIKDVTFTKLQNVVKEYLTKIDKLNLLTIGKNSKDLKANFKKQRLSIFKQVLKESNTQNSEPVVKKLRKKKEVKKHIEKKIEKFENMQKKLSVLNPSLVDAQFFTDSYNSEENNDYIMQGFQDKSYVDSVISHNDKNKLDVYSSESDYKQVSIQKSINESLLNSQDLQKNLAPISHSNEKHSKENIDGNNVADNEDLLCKIINNSPDEQTTVTKLINRVKPLQNYEKNINDTEPGLISEMDSLEYLQTQPYFDNQEQLEQAFDSYIKYKQNPSIPVNDAKINLIGEMIEETSQFFKTNNHNRSKDVYDISNICTNNKNENKKKDKRVKKKTNEKKNLINFSYRRSTKTNIENISINSKNAIVHMKINTKEKTSSRTITRQRKSNVESTKKRKSNEKTKKTLQNKKQKMSLPTIEIARHEENNNLNGYKDIDCMFDDVFNLNDENSKAPDQASNKYNIKSKRLTKTYHKNAVPKILLSKLITPVDTLGKPENISEGISVDMKSVDYISDKIVNKNDKDSKCGITKNISENVCPTDNKWILNKFFSNFSSFEDNNNNNEVAMKAYSINSLGSSPIRAGQHSSTNYTKSNLENIEAHSQADNNNSNFTIVESSQPKNNNHRNRTSISSENVNAINNNLNYSANLNSLCIENFVSSENVENTLVQYNSTTNNLNCKNYRKNISTVCNNTLTDCTFDILNKRLTKHNNITSVNNHSNESILVSNLKTDFENMFVNYANEKSDVYFFKSENMVETINKNIKNIFERYFVKMNEIQNRVEKHKNIIQNLYEQLSNEQKNYAEIIKDSIQCKTEIAKHLRAANRMKTEIITMEKNNSYILEKDVLNKKEELKKILWQIFITNVADEMKNYIMCFL